MLLATTPASAEVPQSLKDACSAQTAAPGFTYRYCDDGIPTGGGAEANTSGARAIRVPAAYAGFEGLPAKDAALAARERGADSNGDVAIDANVSLPSGTPPAGGWPLVVMMHGCCAGDKTGWEAQRVPEGERLEGRFGEQWHYNNAWFASRGYAVLTYTSRGFVNSSGDGSTGETRIQSRRYEMNDMQHLAGQLADDPFFGIDPHRVVVTGGSYGGGFSWMALTDPIWRSPAGKEMRLAAVAPKYGWTDIAYTLIPNGSHSASPSRMPAFDGSDTSGLIGTPKISILAGLYASGKTGVPPLVSAHATFASAIDDAFTCLNGTYPLETSSLCRAALDEVLPTFLEDNSAYYQQRFFENAARDRRYRVPTFNAGTLTDPLFPPIENHRMVNRMRATAASWPLQQHFGDVQHFVRNKDKEWNDVCEEGGSRRKCALADYGGDLDATPAGLVRTGTTTLLNRFLDHHVRPAGNPDEPKPRYDVTVAPEVCGQNAGAEQRADEPGPRLVAPTYAGLADAELRFRWGGPKTILNPVLGNRHALAADPVVNQVANGNRCPEADGPAGVGVATYTSPTLREDTTTVGPGTITVDYRGAAQRGLINARLYDLFPDGRRVLVDRAPSRTAAGSGVHRFELQGTVYLVKAGHRLALELTQDDSPFVKFATAPSSMTLESVELRLPSRAFPAPAPRVTLKASRRTARRVTVTWAPRAGAAPLTYDVQVRRARGRSRGRYRSARGLSRTRRETAPFTRSRGRTDIRVRARDELGRTGSWARIRVARRRR